MIDVITWLRDKLQPIPHAAELRGKTRKDMERTLRAKGFSQREAKRFVFRFKARLRD
jgi:hypothetical protein